MKAVSPFFDITTIDTRRFGEGIRKRFRLQFEVPINERISMLITKTSILATLHISKKEYRSLVRSDPEGLRRRIREFILLREKPIATPEVNDLFLEIFRRFDCKGWELVSKGNGKPTGVTAIFLKKALISASNYDTTSSYKFWLDDNGNQRYLVRLLGEGTYSRVYFFVDLQQQLMGVFKKARRKHIKPKKAVRSLERECRILERIHQHKDLWGIRDNNIQMVELQTTKISNNKVIHKIKQGYVGTKYDSSYVEVLLVKDKYPTEEQLLFEFHQLSAGMETLAKIGILHGDIKPDNIFVKNVGGLNFLFIGDFGGAIGVDEVLPIERFVSGLKRDADFDYTLIRDLEIGEKLAELGDKEAIIYLERSREVFSLGLVMSLRFYGEGDIDVLGGTIPELKPLINSMIREDFNKRPLISEVFTAIDTIIRNRYPKLAKEIDYHRSSLK